MALSRRALLMWLASAPAWAAPPPRGGMRFMVLRHQTLLLEVEGRRVLLDPALSRDLGLGPLLHPQPSPLRPEELGVIDVLCVSAHAPGAFDAWTTRALRSRDAACLVADERTARVLRGQGFTRVRVVDDALARGDEPLRFRGLQVRAARWRGAFGIEGAAFLIERNGRTFLHAGAPAPITPESELASFARAHRAEVLAVCAQGLSSLGTAITFDADDADALAAMCRARVELRLGYDTRASALGGLVLSQDEVPRMRASRASSARVVVPTASTWYRVTPQ